MNLVSSLAQLHFDFFFDRYATTYDRGGWSEMSKNPSTWFMVVPPESDGVGGICQSRVRIKSDRNAYSFNALFISLKSLQEFRIPLRMGVLNLGRSKLRTRHTNSLEGMIP